MLIPHYFLYGEQPRTVDDRFAHLESLDDRSGPANWTIRPHAHRNLCHLFLIDSGSGLLHADAERLLFEGPCALLVPASVVHGLNFDPGARGCVLTLSEALRARLATHDRLLDALFSQPRVLSLGDRIRTFDCVLRRLGHELAWTAPGQGAMVQALALEMFVELVRLAHHGDDRARRRNGAYAGLVTRFRREVELHFRTVSGVTAFATRMNCTPRRLRAACLCVAGVTPGQMIQDRRMLEAKRLLSYSDMSVAETAYHLGFEDPAYFSRFFTKHCGISPRDFQAASNS